MAEENLNKKVFSGLIWKFGERFTAELVTFVVSIVLARLLMPDDYGVIALMMVFITIANVFVINKKRMQIIETFRLFFILILFFQLQFILYFLLLHLQ